MNSISIHSHSTWLDECKHLLARDGFVILTDCFNDTFRNEITKEVTILENHFKEMIGEALFQQRESTGDYQLRFPHLFSNFFLSLLEEPMITSLVNTLFTPQALLRFYNATILKQRANSSSPEHYSFHMNFKKSFHHYMAALDVVYFSELSTDLVQIVPGSHQLGYSPEQCDLEKTALLINIPAQGLLVMDGSTWHRERQSPTARGVQLHLQFCRPYMKPHLDFVRAFGEDKMKHFSSTLQQYLGWYSRVPTSIEDFYSHDRLYRSDQW